MDFTKDEQLAYLVAVDKKLSPALKAAKEDAGYALMDDFERTHSDRHAIMVGSTKVGEVGMSFTTPKPAVIPGREVELLDALEELGYVERTPKKGWESLFVQAGPSVVCKETGEEAPFLVWEESRRKGTQVRGCKPEDVLAAFGPRLNGADAIALLEGETNG